MTKYEGKMSSEFFSLFRGGEIGIFSSPKAYLQGQRLGFF